MAESSCRQEVKGVDKAINHFPKRAQGLGLMNASVPFVIPLLSILRPQ